MAQTWRSKHLQHESAMDDRLRDELLALIGPITRVLLRHATTTNEAGERIIPNRGRVRDLVRREVWNEALKPYFIGAGDTPLDGTAPQSPFMRTVVDGIQGNVALVVERVVGDLRRACDEDVFAWLTEPRAIQQQTPDRAIAEQTGPRDPRRPWYDPFHLFVDEGGHTLSENGWRTARGTRQAIDNLLDYHIRMGTAAVDLADLLEPYLWPEAARVRTRTPYGEDGSYWARRLARTEITAAAGRSLVNVALANPFSPGVKWNLSASHPCCDVCDELAAGGPNGDGVYPVADLPAYPGHPHCICYLTQEVTQTPAEINRTLRGWIEDDVPEARALRGAFNPDWLLNALVNGNFVATVLDDALIQLVKLATLMGA